MKKVFINYFSNDLLYDLFEFLSKYIYEGCKKCNFGIGIIFWYSVIY